MNPKYYLKAIVAALLAGLGALVTASQARGGSVHSGDIGLAAAVAITTFINTYSASNEPKGATSQFSTVSGFPVISDPASEFPVIDDGALSDQSAVVLPPHSEANLPGGQHSAG